jgi:DeoR family fructose operon transcriptional repressor
MNFQKRKQLILEKLALLGEVEIKQLAAETGASEITIRRDLNELAADGLLYRTHGGAMLENPLQLPYQFADKDTVNAAAKDLICRRAAAEIQDGDILFLDCGSTVFRLCQFIRQKKIKVITNSLPVACALQNSKVSLNLVGGELDADRQAVHGKMAEAHIKKYRAGKAFLGVDGISAKGLFANSEKEAAITLALAAQSALTYLLCDAGKIGRETYLRFAGLQLVQTVITNAAARQVTPLRKQGLRVITVHK